MNGPRGDGSCYQQCDQNKDHRQKAKVRRKRKNINKANILINDGTEFAFKETGRSESLYVLR